MKKYSAVIAAMVHEFMTNQDCIAEKYKLSCQSEFGFLQEKGKMIPFLTPKRLAESFDVSQKTLERMRQDGSGPEFIRISKKFIRYPVVGLDRWVRELIVQNGSLPVQEQSANDQPL